MDENSSCDAKGILCILGCCAAERREACGCGEMSELAEGARLEIVYTPKGYPGFKSLSLRHFYAICGEVAERLNAAVSKTVLPATPVTRVRIPASPPVQSTSQLGTFFIPVIGAWIRTDEGSRARKTAQCAVFSEKGQALACPRTYFQNYFPNARSAVGNNEAFRAERFSAEPLFREAKWNPAGDARVYTGPAAAGSFHNHLGCQDSLLCTSQAE